MPRLAGRDARGHCDPKNQRPELWNIFNSRIDKGESIRVFPLSNWTELDIWLYIHAEQIPIVPLYFAREHEVVMRGGSIVLRYPDDRMLPGERTEIVKCRMRSLGCVPCTGAIRSEVIAFRKLSRRWFRSGARSARTA